MKPKSIRFLCALFALALLASLLAPIALASNGSVTVYITDTGTVYHRKGCTYLQSRHAVTLEYAVDHGYTRCTRCDPAVLGNPKSTDNDPYEPPPYKPHTNGNSSGNGSSHTGSVGSSAKDEPTNWLSELIEVLLGLAFFGTIGLFGAAFLFGSVIGIIQKIAEFRKAAGIAIPFLSC